MSSTRESKKTLDELDPPAWGEPEFPSHLVTTCHRLRRKPIGQFEVEELRIMIGQSIGLEWLVPLALKALEAEPLVSGDFFDGDLLKNVVQIDAKYWKTRPGECRRCNALLTVDVDARLENDECGIREAIAAFRAR